MIPRGVLMLLLVAVATGCSSLRSTPPRDLVAAGEITVMVDGFHSAIVLPRSMVQVSVPAYSTLPGDLTSVHFGEERWLLDPTVGTCYAIGLGLGGGSGVVVLNALEKPDPARVYMEVTKTRLWTFAVNEAGMQAVRDRLQTRWLTERIMTRPQLDAFFIFSPEEWTLGTNCHDFTVDVLRAAGLNLSSPWILQAGGLTDRLDVAKATLDQADVRVIGPQ